ncbi:MAG: hypothetical protein ABF854_05705, partial [Gluconacetobacter sp.]
TLRAALAHQPPFPIRLSGGPGSECAAREAIRRAFPALRIALAAIVSRLDRAVTCCIQGATAGHLLPVHG